MVNDELINSMPDYLLTEHLVKLGVYPSKNAAYMARKNGHGPEFIKMGRKVLYTKEALWRYMDERTHLLNTEKCVIEDVKGGLKCVTHKVPR